MRAALYNRRSTDEHQQASLETQLSEGKRYAASQNFTVDEAHIFVDDAISRAEFKRRPALIALLRGCENGDFDVVITRDETRLGGDMIRTSLLIGEILDHGVKLHYYYTGEDVRLNDATSKFMVAARNYAAELEREKTSQRTHEHLKTKARQGLVAAGKCFGYSNVPVMQGDVRVRVEYQIHPDETEVLLEIFRQYAEGDGLRSIVRTLNAKGVKPPRAGKRGTGSWSPSAIRAMLQNERYLGRVIWNKENEGVYRGGTKCRERRPKEEWIVAERPDLQIIPTELWEAVQARFQAKQHMGRKTSTGPVAKYLLSGFSKCSCCGGPMKVSNSKSGKSIIKVYNCAYHRDRGNCPVTLSRPVEVLDEAVIRWIEGRILREDVITLALAEVRRRLKERAEQPSEVPELEAREVQLNRDIQRLGEALLTTDQPLATITSMLSDKEVQLKDVRARIANLKALPSMIDLETRRLERDARARIAELRVMLRRNPQDARKALEVILKGPLSFEAIQTEAGPRFQVRGQVCPPIDCVPNEI